MEHHNRRWPSPARSENSKASSSSSAWAASSSPTTASHSTTRRDRALRARSAISREIGAQATSAYGQPPTVSPFDSGSTTRPSSTTTWRFAISREIGDRRGEGNRLGSLGIAYDSLGQYDKAIEHYNQALADLVKILDPGNRVFVVVCVFLGIAYGNLGQYDKAIEHHNQALAISREIGDRRGGWQRG